MFAFLARRRLKRKALDHARTLLGTISPRPFPGDLYLAGGVFKSILTEGVEVRDVDIWVKNRAAREAAAEWLQVAGFALEKDFHPYCRVFRRQEQVIEITYENLKEGGIHEVLESFDLGPCQIAARVSNGRADDLYATPDFWESTSSRTIKVARGYWHGLKVGHSPKLLLTLHRLGNWGDSLGWQRDHGQITAMWRMFIEEYSPAEARLALALAEEIIGGFKGEPDAPILERARRELATRIATKSSDL